MQVIVKALVIAGFVAISVFPQAPEPSEARIFERVYLAKDDGAGKPGEETTEFNTTDIPIHCVVVLSNASPATVMMRLIAVGSAGADRDREVISARYTTRDLEDHVYFNGKPQKLWIAGAYRADIYVDGNLVGKFPFTIKGAPVPIKPAMNFQPKQPIRPRSATAKRT